MAITKGAKKAIKSHARKRAFNIRTSRTLHDKVKTVKTAIAQKDTKTAEANMSAAYKAIDKAEKRGLIKKNTANRKKSRLMKAVATK